MVESKSRLRLKYGLAWTWLAFTLSFAVWWMYFGLQQLHHMAALLPEPVGELTRHRRMMIWEGSAWMVLLLAGGLTLIGFVAREARRSQEMKTFFAAFTHDMKTSLASLRIQAESLKEDFKDQDLPVLDRLVGDTVRLNLQLQNSLFLASHEDMKLYTEKLKVADIISELAPQWPRLVVRLEQDQTVAADRRALVSVFANLMQNAVLHGGASEFFLRPQLTGQEIEIQFSDNGRGFKGDSSKLATLFHRHGAGSGSGVGLYISRRLVERMGGRLEFANDLSQGFKGRIQLPRSPS